MKYDFETLPDRRNTGSMKWERYKDRDILPFWVADMDFKSPPEVIEALRRRVDHEVFGYTEPPEETVEAVQHYLKQVHGLEVDRKWFVWLPGLVPALNAAARAFGEPGDAVLTATPVYPPFLTAPGNQHKVSLSAPVMLNDEGRYTLDFQALERAVTPRTRVFFLCNPHNPVGRAYNQAELTELFEFCRRFDLILVSDEIHCDLLVDKGVRHIPGLKIAPDAPERTVMMMAPSKTFNLPGLACAFCVVPEVRLRADFQRAARGMITEVNCLGYTGCAAAYRDGLGWLAELQAVLRRNRDRLYSFIQSECPLIDLRPMEATYLAWMDCRKLNLGRKLHAHFETHGIGLSNGELFGWPGWLRFNFGCPPSHLERGLERFKAGYDAAVR